MQVNTQISVAFRDGVAATDNSLTRGIDIQDSNGVVTTDVAKEASGLVEQMIANSLHRLTKSPVKIDWPTGSEITSQKGLAAIETCIQVHMTTPIDFSLHVYILSIPFHTELGDRSELETLYQIPWTRRLKA